MRTGLAGTLVTKPDKPSFSLSPTRWQQKTNFQTHMVAGALHTCTRNKHLKLFEVVNMVSTLI